MADKHDHPISIREVNEIGKLTATYQFGSSAAASPSTSDHGVTPRSGGGVSVLYPPKTRSTFYFSTVLDAFLPVGYPHSVSSDYLEYQIYDSLQAFSSSIAGLLSSRAVLQGVGVGDASASPTAALLLNIVQESMGRIATILFAHRLGTSLEPECKMYRLAADVLNDSAMIVDCLLPIFSKPMRVVLLSTSSVLRALCGLAAGSSKASLSAHFAKWGNLGELNAKDSSQETVISLMGMLAGSFVVSHVTSPFATWVALILLLLVHITMNYAAVRAVKMTTLNRQRANIAFSTLFDENRILTPHQTSKQERIFERDGILRWKASSLALGSCRIGIPFSDMLALSSVNKSSEKGSLDVHALLDIFRYEEYILWFCPSARNGAIVLKTGATPISQLKAWSHALWVSRYVAAGGRWKNDDGGNEIFRPGKFDASSPKMLKILKLSLGEISKYFDGSIIQRLKDEGWDIDTPSLETRPGRRLDFRKSE